MSHFSQIKTSLKSIKILKKTLKDMNFTYITAGSCLQNNDQNLQSVDILVKKNQQSIMGFSWNGQEYLLVVDEQAWTQDISVNKLTEKLLQQYALNLILKDSATRGFKEINKETMQDGSIRLIVQKWS